MEDIKKVVKVSIPLKVRIVDVASKIVESCSIKEIIDLIIEVDRQVEDYEMTEILAEHFDSVLEDYEDE